MKNKDVVIGAKLILGVGMKKNYRNTPYTMEGVENVVEVVRAITPETVVEAVTYGGLYRRNWEHRRVAEGFVVRALSKIQTSDYSGIHPLPTNTTQSWVTLAPKNWRETADKEYGVLLLRDIRDAQLYSTVEEWSIESQRQREAFTAKYARQAAVNKDMTAKKARLDFLLKDSNLPSYYTVSGSEGITIRLSPENVNEWINKLENWL